MDPLARGEWSTPRRALVSIHDGFACEIRPQVYTPYESYEL